LLALDHKVSKEAARRERGPPGGGGEGWDTDAQGRRPAHTEL
jgi:hypothetical protein